MKWLLAIVTLLAACMAQAPSSDAPAQPRRLVVNGAELTYVEHGSGELVVFLHGTATDYRIWEQVRRAFGPEFRFVAYSRRHHAPNAPLAASADYTTKQHAEDLVGLITALGETRAHVVGVALSARIAAYAAVHYPKALRSLTLSDGFLASPTTESGKRELERIEPQFNRLFAAIGARDYSEAVAAYVDLASPGSGWKGLPEPWKGYYLDNASTLGLAVSDPTAREIDCAALGKIRVPVLVLAGERTPPAIRATNEALLHCLLAGAEYALVPGAAHYWYVDNPGEATRLLKAFMRRRGGN